MLTDVLSIVGQKSKELRIGYGSEKAISTCTILSLYVRQPRNIHSTLAQLYTCLMA